MEKIIKHTFKVLTFNIADNEIRYV